MTPMTTVLSNGLKSIMVSDVIHRLLGRKFGILERKIAIPILLFSTMIAVIATGFQIWFEYRKDVSEVGQRFDIINNSYLESLSSALWVMDPQQVQTIAAGIYSLPDVGYIRIHWEDDREFMRLGSPMRENVISKDFNLSFRNGQGTFPVGRIYVQLTLTNAVKRGYSRFLVILLTNGIKSFIVCIFIFFIVHRLITRHLNQMSSYLNDKSSNGDLNLDKNNNDHDEIDTVVEALNEMRQDLQLYINDIIDHKVKLEQSVQDKTTALKSAFEDKTNLLRIVCHDLANPLSIISGSIEMINMVPLPPEKKTERLKAIERACNLMSEILNNVREMESISSGKKSIDLDSVDLGQIFENVEFVFKDRLKEKDLTLKIDNKVPKGIHCLADPVSLGHQVLNNLVSNAIKFSFNHTTITISAYLEGEQIHITVKDTGVGMSQEHLAKIFDPNSQTTRTGTQGESGTGFGMPLVKTYVEKFGGKIEVDSTSAEKNLNLTVALSISILRQHPKETKTSTKILADLERPLNESKENLAIAYRQ